MFGGVDFAVIIVSGVHNKNSRTAVKDFLLYLKTFDAYKALSFRSLSTFCVGVLGT